MFKCKDCGKLVEELEKVAPTYDDSGYTEDFCEDCGSFFVEAYQCKECGEWFTQEEMEGDVCQDCIKKSINVEIISEYVKKYDLHNDIYDYLKEFIDNDPYHFGQFLAERGIK